MEYTQYMQELKKLVPKIKALHDNEERATRIINTMQKEVEKMRVTRSFQPAWMLELYTYPLRVSTIRTFRISENNEAKCCQQAVQAREWTAAFNGQDRGAHHAVGSA